MLSCRCMWSDCRVVLLRMFSISMHRCAVDCWCNTGITICDHVESRHFVTNKALIGFLLMQPHVGGRSYWSASRSSFNWPMLRRCNFRRTAMMVPPRLMAQHQASLHKSKSRDKSCSFDCASFRWLWLWSKVTLPRITMDIVLNSTLAWKFCSTNGVARSMIPLYLPSRISKGCRDWRSHFSYFRVMDIFLNIIKSSCESNK